MGYHISTVRYEKMTETGEIKRVSEKYLTDSLSVTEAEAIVTGRLAPYISGDMEVTKVEKSAIAEVMGNHESDRFFLSKVAFINIDERSGKEKRNMSQWLIGATDYDAAKAILQDEIGNSMADIEIVGLVESPIVEYFPTKPTSNGE
ncbi:MAG: DUF4494 domain-containing protein [Muribaculaceae bacterium]|nr:DUF4494 domain-containing protein [Muribaculaceae bacterium]